MLRLSDFETMAGETATGTVFVGGFLPGSNAWHIALELFFSGVVVVAIALGSGSGGQALLKSFSGCRPAA